MVQFNKIYNKLLHIYQFLICKRNIAILYMIGYIFAIITIVFLITITITSHYLLILNSDQVKTLWISTILMIILLGYVRSTVLNLEPISLYIFMPAGLYTIWYILTKSSANMINKDSETGIIRDTSF
jgi:hypothetical protein